MLIQAIVTLTQWFSRIYSRIGIVKLEISFLLNIGWPNNGTNRFTVIYVLAVKN